MIAQVHLSLLLCAILLLFSIFVLRYPSSDRCMSKPEKKSFSCAPGSQHGDIPGPLHRVGSEGGVTGSAETCDVLVKNQCNLGRSCRSLPGVTALTPHVLSSQESSEREVGLLVSEWGEKCAGLCHVHPLFSFSPSAMFWLLFSCLYYF